MRASYKLKKAAKTHLHDHKAREGTKKQKVEKCFLLLSTLFSLPRLNSNNHIS